MIAWVASALAGPWVHDAGHYYAKGELSGFFGLEGQAPESDSLTYNDGRAAVYGEVGLGLDTMATAYLPYVVSVNSAPDARHLALGGGDAELGFTRALTTSGVRLAAEARARLPLYPDRRAERLARFGVYGPGFPVPGDGSRSADLTLHAGGSIPRGWVQAAAGYRYRLARVDGIVYDAVVGLNPEPGWAGIGIGGVANLGSDGVTRQWTTIRLFGAHRIAGITFAEASVGVLPAAREASPGLQVAIGVSARR